ncbi:aldehyde dehydrogenase family protein [Paenibacillus humicola]|uniref:aldehyde dehydrogenase family protein n=1 Tax=Paenibacillus humicola TaxID=3110540 RepID=UPI00237C3418|nr:aldehyde dehydrogenase family protein [Paenibacillus humicola]
MKQTKLWIGGKWVEGSRLEPLLNPHTGEKLADIGYASPEQAAEAIESAAEAFRTFREAPIHQRAGVLYRVARIIEERAEEAARLIAEEAAKPIKAARGEIQRTVQTYTLAAEAAKTISGEVVPMDAVPHGDHHTAYVIRQPKGVVTAITPFNFPFNLVAHKVGPAVAAGNAIVLKPAEKTPLSALFLAGVFKEAGLPDGVLNIIPGGGKELSETLTTHEKVAFVTFTGSPAVGKIIRAQAGLRTVTLELGSNSPLLIDRGFDGEELDRIADAAAAGAFSYNGQVCISIQRIYVHEDAYEEFTNRLVRKAESLRIGDPLSEDTDISALINEQAAKRLRSWVERAAEGGAAVRCGGTFEGSIMHPTVMTGVPDEAELNCEEAFGPVVSVKPFRTWDEAIGLANDSKFGLNAGAFTKDLEHALKAAKNIRAGGVLINEIPTYRVDHMPYGGLKESGVGREGVKYAMEEMMELKLVAFRTGFYE